MRRALSALCPWRGPGAGLEDLGRGNYVGLRYQDFNQRDTHRLLCQRVGPPYPPENGESIQSPHSDRLQEEQSPLPGCIENIPGGSVG